MNVLLQGIGGSVAHGLAGSDSDTDRYGVYAAPTLDLITPWSEPHKAASRDEEQNLTLWEVGNFAGLLANCNPSAMELLWLPSDLIEVETPYGKWLRDLRTDVLAAEPIREKYSSMVGQQRRHLVGETRKPQAAKLVRHGLRVAEQGLMLLRTGRVQVRATYPETFLRFDDDPWAAFRELEELTEAIQETPSDVLPAELNPDARESVRQWVRSVRLAHLT